MFESSHYVKKAALRRRKDKEVILVWGLGIALLVALSDRAKVSLIYVH